MYETTFQIQQAEQYGENSAPLPVSRAMQMPQVELNSKSGSGKKCSSDAGSTLMDSFVTLNSAFNTNGSPFSTSGLSIPRLISKPPFVSYHRRTRDFLCQHAI